MDKLEELIKKCKGSVSIEINSHKDSLQDIEDYIEDLYVTDELYRNIDEDILKEIKRKDAIIEIVAYPYTQVGFYIVIHHDLDKAIEMMLNKINQL